MTALEQAAIDATAKRAIETFGMAVQLRKVAEECCELATKCLQSLDENHQITPEEMQFLQSSGGQ